MRVVIACSTRGEGGQNAIGPERGAALGALRTREMEEAARRLDASIAWLGHGPDDPVHDFGFSKDGDDTLKRWGEERIVGRLVEAYRRYRPDIVIPTFLDVPGQHGHHRAMTRAAIAAVPLAAEGTAFAEQALEPWCVPKLYLPAWSGGGGTYDDEAPPPEATMSLRPPGRDPATGATFSQLGEQSRFFHASQGMGRWTDGGPEEWPLHLYLAERRPNREDDIGDGLPRGLAGLADLDGAPKQLSSALRTAQAAVDDAVAAFPGSDHIVASAAAAAEAVEAALAACPEHLAPIVAHRLERKRREIYGVLFEAGGVVAPATARPPRIAAGQRRRSRLPSIGRMQLPR
jgi:LmbE family N-acetylglucosaminyl deacetylase